MKLKLIAAAILSGVFLSLAWLGFTGLVLLVAFIPLLWIENYIIQHRSRFNSIVFCGYSLLTFLIWNSLTTWWIWYATPFGALFAIIVNSVLMSLVWWISHILRRKRGDGFGNIFLISCWISFEYLHYNWDLAWPWLNLGNGLANDILFIQWYEYTGVLGGTLWILATNLLLWKLYKSLIENASIQIHSVSVSLLVIIIPVCLSIVQFLSYNEESNPVKIVISQPNIDPYLDKFSEKKIQDQYNRLITMADSLGNDSIDFFVGPETALHQIWLNNWKFNQPIISVQDFLNHKYPNAAFVVGAMCYYKYPNTADAPPTARYNQDSTYLYDAFNSALFITKSGPQAINHKSNLVPGVEKMPFKSYLGFMDHIMINLGGTTGSLATSNQPEVFTHNGIVVGVPICYESVFGEYVYDFIKKGAEILFVITNDGWWNNSPGYRQHLSYSRILAIEYRRSIARSANTGISAFIDQKGQITQSTQWWTKSSLYGELNRNEKISFYARYGDFIAQMSLFMLVMMVLSFILGKYRK